MDAWVYTRFYGILFIQQFTFSRVSTANNDFLLDFLVVARLFPCTFNFHLISDLTFSMLKNFSGLSKPSIRIHTWKLLTRLITYLQLIFIDLLS